MLIDMAAPQRKRAVTEFDSGSFADGRGRASWPPSRSSLAALIEVGLSNAQLAAYFSVSPDDVYMLRDDYQLRA